MSAHDAIGGTLAGLLALAISVVIIFYLVRWIRRTFRAVGLTPGEIAFILWATFLGSLVNIPLVPFGEGFLAINVGGGIMPVLISFYLIRRRAIPLNEVLVGIVLVALVAHLVSSYEPGLGVVSRFPFWLFPAITAFVVAAAAFWHERSDSAALAYAAGTLGTLIGADLVRIPLILSGPAPEAGVVLSIGGAAVFDMVYLTGIIAVSMETSLLVKRRQDLARSGRSNPIDQEYEAWVERKRVQYEEIANERARFEARRPAPNAPSRPRQATGGFSPVRRPPAPGGPVRPPAPRR